MHRPASKHWARGIIHSIKLQLQLFASGAAHHCNHTLGQLRSKRGAMRNSISRRQTKLDRLVQRSYSACVAHRPAVSKNRPRAIRPFLEVESTFCKKEKGPGGPSRMKKDKGRGRRGDPPPAPPRPAPRDAGRAPSTGQRRPALPRADPAVPSALGGLASGFGMGPGVPRPPWPLTGGRRSSMTMRLPPTL